MPTPHGFYFFRQHFPAEYRTAGPATFLLSAVHAHLQNAGLTAVLEMPSDFPKDTQDFIPDAPNGCCAVQSQQFVPFGVDKEKYAPCFDTPIPAAAFASAAFPAA